MTGSSLLTSGVSVVPGPQSRQVQDRSSYVLNVFGLRNHISEVGVHLHDTKKVSAREGSTQRPK
jgi:hypothetical protein